MSKQRPAPSQVSWLTWVVPTHEGGLPHERPSGELWQALLPSHMPVLHVAVAHSFPGSVPAATGPQTPSFPAPLSAAEQASQSEPQAVSQQKPSMQKSLWQWPFALHAMPSASLGTHAPALQ